MRNLFVVNGRINEAEAGKILKRGGKGFHLNRRKYGFVGKWRFGISPIKVIAPLDCIGVVG